MKSRWRSKKGSSWYFRSNLGQKKAKTKKCPRYFSWIIISVVYLFNVEYLMRSYYTRCITQKRVMGWRGPSPRDCARATQLFSKKCRSGGELLAKLCPIWPAQDLNLRPPAPETNALPLDQLLWIVHYLKRKQINPFLPKLWSNCKKISFSPIAVSFSPINKNL